jgi:ABC-type cobalamin/Fe3+-siderophores transport system ATPase subunit
LTPQVGIQATAEPAPPISASAAPASLRAGALRVSLGARTVLDGVSLELADGAVTALVGPNGSGKSTLLRTLARVIEPEAGAVVLDGRAIHSMRTADVARRLAYLPQDALSPPGMTVRALVELGRRPHLGRLGFMRAADRDAVEWAIAATDLEGLAERRVDTLSGGERQRAWLALALAQRTSLLLLDEPTTYLDVRHQIDVMGLVRRLNAEHGLTVCWVLHDLNAASAYSDAMVWLREGRVLAAGPCTQLLTPDLVRRTFEVDASIVPDPRTGRPVCLPSMGSSTRGP